jgi:gliding motility-associated-like protein
MARLLLLICLISNAAYGQNQHSWQYGLPISFEKQTDSTNTPSSSTWKELPEERTIFSKAFNNPLGYTKHLFSSVPLHYKDENGNLLSLELSYQKTADGIFFNQQEFPMHVLNDGSFGIQLNPEAGIRIGSETKLNGNEVQKNLEEYGAISYVSFFGFPLMQQIEFGNGKIGFHYRLLEPLSQLDGDLIIDENIQLPTGWSIRKSDTLSNQNLIVDQAGKNRAVLTNILCYDAANHLLAVPIEVQGNFLRMHIPSAWLNDPARVYPITIDPLIAGIPSIWNGGQMPSCFMPAYNEDSIQVTIPAGVTPTGVYVDASFYANPFTFATMSQGSMYFSSSCGASQTFTVTGATAGLAGTAYLDSFNLMNPLVCCLQKSCNPIQFWVSMHLGRNAFGPGCNTNYILYDPLTTSWPFKVVVYGRTPESYGNEWYTAQTPICSNKCQVSATAYARYGVPPYTFSHPWTTTIGTAGQNAGCNTGASNFVFTLDVPNCPVYCDASYTSLSIPPPVVTDACGSVIAGLQPATKPLIAAIEPDLTYDSVICNGTAIQILNPPCIPDGVTQFYDANSQGFGDVNTQLVNSSDSLLTTTYYFFAERQGCFSDTIAASVTIVPNPTAAINFNPNPLVVGNSSSISNASISTVSTVFTGIWTSSDSTWMLDSAFFVSYDAPGSYTYCLQIADDFGCTDSICSVLNVVPATIENINVVTPNNDGINDELYFQYLDFYPNSQIEILNRWGQLIFQSEDYQNDWNGESFTEGTYFYKLYVPGLEKTLQSFFVLEK